MVEVETPYIKVVYNTKEESLLINWLQKPGDDIFREVYLQLLRLATLNNLVKLYCVDLSCIGAFSREQEMWLILEYYPMVYSEIKDNIHVAVVFSEDHFKAVVANYQVSTLTEQHQFIDLTYFTSGDEALYWLESLKKGQDKAVLPAAS